MHFSYSAFGFFQTLSANDLRDPEISALIAAKMREFHKLDIPGPKNVVLWNRMRYIVLHTYLLNPPFRDDDT